MHLSYIGLGFIFISLFLPWGEGSSTLIAQLAEIFSYFAYVLVFGVLVLLAVMDVKFKKFGLGFGVCLLLIGFAYLGLNLIVRCQEISCTPANIGISPFFLFTGLILYTLSFRKSPK